MATSTTGDKSSSKPVTEFELAYGNVVEISGAQNLLHDDQFACSWLNSTTWRHALDGRVLFILFYSPGEQKLKLFALGFGQHWSKVADAINPDLGSAVFSTMLETFLAALERYIKTTAPKTFDSSVLDALILSLKTSKVETMALPLYLKHLFFEVLNLGAIPGAQWTRMIMGANTTSSPSPKKPT